MTKQLWLALAAAAALGIADPLAALTSAARRRSTRTGPRPPAISASASAAASVIMWPASAISDGAATASRAVRSSTRAVASFSRLSPSSSVDRRRGSLTRCNTARADTASGGDAGVGRASSFEQVGGERDAVAQILAEIYAAAAHFHLRLPELFCGFPREPGEPPIAYPVACLPQAWAAGSVFLMLQAALGLAQRGEDGVGAQELVRGALAAEGLHHTLHQRMARGDLGQARARELQQHRGHRGHRRGQPGPVGDERHLAKHAALVERLGRRAPALEQPQHVAAPLHEEEHGRAQVALAHDGDAHPVVAHLHGLQQRHEGLLAQEGEEWHGHRVLPLGQQQLQVLDDLLPGPLGRRGVARVEVGDEGLGARVAGIQPPQLLAHDDGTQQLTALGPLPRERLAHGGGVPHGSQLFQSPQFGQGEVHSSAIGELSSQGPLPDEGIRAALFRVQGHGRGTLSLPWLLPRGAQRFGNTCWPPSAGANRSPTLSSRRRNVPSVKRVGSNRRVTSDQHRGVDTGACGRARGE